MKFRKPMMVRMLDAVQGRFRRARPGSVLIMVVSLLVLLALIGTAAMSTSRLDRTGSLQNVKNVQVDLIAEGVKQMVLGVLTKDATAGNSVDSTVLSPDTPPNPIPNQPALVDQANAILASLLPERQLTRNAVSGSPDFATGNPPGPNRRAFQSVSYPPVQTGFEQLLAPATGGGVHIGPYKFDVPTEPSSDPQYYGLPASKPTMVPTVVTMPDGSQYPGLQAMRPDGNPMTFFPNRDGTPSAIKSRVGESPFIAADTDGDGVADAMLVKLPITPVNGITYYAAVRVVDNAAKINLNTAGNPNNETAQVNVRVAGTWTATALSFAGIYPASVWLDNMFDPTTTDPTEKNLKEADKFSGQRVFGDRLWGTGAVPNATPYNYDQTARNDFVFLTPGDALHNQLGRRLDNPSVVGPNPNAGGKIWYYGNGTRPFGISDAMALAHRFTLINPVATDSTVEKTLFMTVLNNKPGVNKAYPLSAAGIAAWFDDNFDYKWLTYTPADQAGWAANKTWLLRSMLTAFNPVTTTTPQSNVPQDLYRMRYVSDYARVDPAFPATGNFPPANPPVDYYVDPKIPDWTKAEQQQPMAAAAQKVPDVYTGKANVNTAQFEELWRRYFDVMCETAFSSPFDAGANDDIYQGSSFNHGSPFTSNPTEHMARMFRSPIRPEIPAAGPSSQIARLHPYQVMALRAAIAAANTIALRSDYDVNQTIISDRNIPFFEIILPQVDATYDHTTYNAASAIRPNFYGGVGATVYGVKRQPFITEVFLDNNTEALPNGTTPPPPTNADGNNARNQQGFAAIEIHNPYDRPMRISGWKLGLVDRHQTTDGGVTGVDWQNQTDVANDRRPPKLQVVDLPDNTSANGWTPDNPYATPYVPFTFGPNDIIPPHGYLVVSNLPLPGTTPPVPTSDTDAAQYAPADTKINALVDSTTTDPTNGIYKVGGVKVVYAKKLHWMIGREIQLLRPVDRRLTDTAGADKGFWVVRWAPVDSFDGTGMLHNVASGTALTTADEWHYVRANDPANNRAWHFVYPGRYEAITGVGAHHQGIEQTGAGIWTSPGTNPSPWAVTSPTPSQFGLPDGHNSRDLGQDYPTLAAVSTFPIQVANTDFASQFNRTAAPAGPAFPLNGFARIGDLMQVTYIGSYTLWDADANWGQDLKSPFTNFTTPAALRWVHQPTGSGGDTNTVGGINARPAPIVPYLAGGGGRFIESNPITMDAAFAEDTDTTDDVLKLPASPTPATSLALEDIGRFAPITFDRTTYSATPVADVNALKYDDGVIFATGPITDTFTLPDNWLKANFPTDYWNANGYECVITNLDPATQNQWKVQVRRVKKWDQNANTIQLESNLSPSIPAPAGPFQIYRFKLQRIRYGWASKLFDYFTTTNSPGNDYLPNVDPFVWGTNEVVKNVSDPSRKPNRTGLPTEDDVAAEGLININTANWKTLAQLPLVMDASASPPQVDQARTEALAREIVYYRDVDDFRGVNPTGAAAIPPHPHGPFKSVQELCLIPDFMTAMGTIDGTNDLTKNPGVLMGDYSPMSNTGDGVRWDFKEKYLTLTRISNLVTTKSDSFTAYIQVQGWRDAGTADAKLAVQKRLSFIIDRSKVTTSGKTPTVYNVPVAE